MANDKFCHDVAKQLLVDPFSPLGGFEDPRKWSREPLGFDNGAAPLNPFDPDNVYTRLWDKPLLRIYDDYSGSQPDPNFYGRIRARSYRHWLISKEERKSTLAAHIDHSNQMATPYISFTSSQDDLEKLAEKRRHSKRGRGGPQKLVVINPRYRFQSGLPLLDYAEEMRAYGISCPYAEDYSKDHYLCLYEVTPPELVGIWNWDFLRNNPNWYNEYVKAKFDVVKSSPLGRSPGHVSWAYI